MNKTVTVNISGIFFHINEDAYEKLSFYLQAIGSYFKHSEGSAEIMADIEARIAEMFKEKLTPAKQIISMEDVEEAIAVMGQPEAFMDEEAAGDTGRKTGRSHKRLFRDPDEQVIGGVCAGIAAYFGFDPFWLRIFFVLLFFVFGTGPLLYIILWIIIPKAKTASEKLEMRGEPINVNNIGKTINEELDNIKKKFDDIKSDTKNSKGLHKAKSVMEDIIELFVSIIKLLFKAVVKIFGVLLIAIGIAFSIFFIGSIIGSDVVLSISPEGISSFTPSELLTIFFANKTQYIMAMVGLILLVGVPILSILFGGFKLLLGIKTKIKGIGIAFGTLWMAGVIICGIVAVQMAREFSKKGTDTNTIVLSPPGNTLYLDMNEDKFYKENNNWQHHRNDLTPEKIAHLIHLEGDQVYFGFPEMNIIKSETDSFEIEIIRSSRSKTYKEAVDRAKQISYEFSETDSLIKFDPYYSIEAEDKFRLQKVKILVKVPEGKSVELSKKMDRIIYDVENVTNTLDSDMVGKNWAMTEKGLTCMNCEE